jgi:hypothetical protein
VNETRTPATVTIDLAAAGLAHAKGRSDKCGAAGHDVNWLSLAGWDNPDLIEAGDVYPVIQALHEQAHPDAAVSWTNCRERPCADVEW